MCSVEVAVSKVVDEGRKDGERKLRVADEGGC